MGGTRGDAQQRAAEAWALRVQGQTWAQIAAACGFKHETNAARAVRAFAGRLPTPDPEMTRAVWRERLEKFLDIALRDAEAGRPGAIRAGVAVAQRAAALDGLDAPTKIATLTPDELQLEALVQEMLKRTGKAPIEEANVLELEVLTNEDGDETYG